MKKHVLKAVTAFLGAPLFLGLSTANAQWIGSGAGGSGTDFNDTANWTGGVINGDFTGNTSSAFADLSGDATLTSLDFRWGTSSVGLTLGGAGTINLGGSVFLPQVSQGGNPITIGSGVTLALGDISAARTFNDGSTGTGRLVVDGLLTGTASGSGRITFGGTSANTVVTVNNTANTFDAPIFINSGILNFTSVSSVGGGPSALGAASSAANGTITMGRNSSLGYIGSTDQTTDRAIVFGSLSAGPVAIQHKGGGGTLTYSTDLEFGTYTGDFRTGAVAGAKLVFEGAISNTTGATRMLVNYQSGTGTTVFQNVANTYLGRTEVQTGVLEVTKLADGGLASSIGQSSNAATNLVLGNNGSLSGTLRYLGEGDSTDRLFSLNHTGGGNIESSGTGALNFTNTGAVAFGGTGNQNRTLRLLGSNTGDNTFALSLGNNGSGTTSFVKLGAGKWILTGTNTYTGNTTVQEGTLFVDGTLTSAVIVNAGVFGGAGSTTGDVMIGNASGTRDAVFAVGADVGGFSTTGALEFKSDAELLFTFNSTTGTGGFIAANGVTIGNSAFLNFIDIGDGGGVSLNDSFVVLSNSGVSSIAGTFSNLADEGQFTANGITWQASYLGGDGNDLVLTAIAVAIPEPGSVALIIGIAGLLTAGLSRRRRAV